MSFGGRRKVGLANCASYAGSVGEVFVFSGANHLFPSRSCQL